MALSFDNLQKAWQAQATLEASESGRQEGDDGQTRSDVASVDMADSDWNQKEQVTLEPQEVPIEQARSEIVAEVDINTAAPVVSTATEEDDSVATAQTTEQNGPPARPTSLMRGLIASFMEQHLTMDVEHGHASPSSPNILGAAWRPDSTRLPPLARSVSTS